MPREKRPVCFDGEQLRSLRKEKNISLQELSFETSVDEAALSRMENGKIQNPYYSTIVRIAEFFGVPIEQFKKPSAFAF